jgi:tetratricopeptide (TPR) repeat protein
MAVRRLGHELRHTDIQIHQTGYVDPALRQRKRERDLRLLLFEYPEWGDHPFTLFNFGMTYLDANCPRVALPFLERSLAGSHPGNSIVRKLYFMMVQCHRQLRQSDQALAVCQRGREHYPNDAELLSQEGQLRGVQGDLAGAVACYQQLLEMREAPHLASVVVGLHGFRTRHNLAVLYHQQDQDGEAEQQWRLAVAEQPAYLPSWQALRELFQAQQRQAELDWVLQHLPHHIR